MTARMASTAPSPPRGVGAGSPDASSQERERPREVGCPFSPMLNKLLILTGSDLEQIGREGNSGERRS